MLYSDCCSLIEVTRGSIVESIHFGAIAVVDASGRLLCGCGNVNAVTYLRSASKPIQVLPFLEDGGMETYRFTEQELAIMCASHSGTDEHVAVIHTMQHKVGLSDADYLCGTHPPMHWPTRKAMLQRGEEPTPSRHTCSGKHTGMLALARLHGWRLEDYIQPEHPVQRLIIKAFSEMSDVPVEDIQIGIDGCSVPVFGVPLCNAALAFARLVDPIHAGLNENRAAACRRVVQAMVMYPDMVAGPERFDTDLMLAGKGKIVAKVGAEGYQLIGVERGVLGKDSPGLGIAYKISDGDEAGRAGALVGLEVLRQLGFTFSVEPVGLARYDARQMKNYNRLIVGEIRPSFHLQWRV